jgi:hypothetical protein
MKLIGEFIYIGHGLSKGMAHRVFLDGQEVFTVCMAAMCGWAGPLAAFQRQFRNP